LNYLRRVKTAQGAKADSYEHVVPAWISKLLGIKTFLSADDAFVSDEALRPRQPALSP
jgi:hypothetical protein